MSGKNSVFDSITNSEDEMIKRAGISKSQACVYLRAYMIIRLLFFKEFVISDSSINLNRALRTLILSGEGNNGDYDLRKLPHADFGELIEEGGIKLAARDIYKGSFSESLRIAQNNKKHVDKPSEEYTRLIDGLCKEENIYWWNAEKVSHEFTEKIRDALKKEFSAPINAYLKELSHRLSDEEILTYNMVKNEVLKTYKETSEEYQIVRTMLRDAYDYNIPEALELSYFRFFNSPLQLIKKREFEINIKEEYEIPWKYSFNTYAFALLPVYDLKFIWASSEYGRYEKAMSEYVNGSGSFHSFLSSLESYLGLIDRVLVSLYNNKYIENEPKNMVARFREYKNTTDPVAVTVEMGQKVYDAAGTAADIIMNPFTGILKLALTNLFPNLIVKKREEAAVMPEIKHAVIKIDK